MMFWSLFVLPIVHSRTILGNLYKKQIRRKAVERGGREGGGRERERGGKEANTRGGRKSVALTTMEMLIRPIENNTLT